MHKTTIGIVEDNAQLGQDIRDKLALSEEVEVLFEVRNGQVLLQTLATGTIPEVLLMDVQMPEMNGIEATWRVKQKYPDLKIVMLTVMDDEQKLFEALQAGASGYLLKDAKPHQLFNAINYVLEGGLPLSPTLASRVLSYLKGDVPIPKPPISGTENLTKREQEILELLMQGKTVKQIAEKIFVADKTVRKHLEHIFEKLQVHSYKELVAKLNGGNK
ncbi:response regulator [Adhaeribacter radiodurans]|uniref:Response regulator transcription factor n=1 Tax=Adhaeribacter radiodurans TaxID=2745197 RepID=A0A7L7LCF8_9BACT|nr:response regulator transcription factor [Adhaeribacter radiodurans]QMU30528.1 response regulator transcription factor [Adhaeribacter radiodurans]